MAGDTSASGAAERPRVVVGVDGSPGSRAALRWALAEASARGAALEVMAAYPVDLYWTDPYLADVRRVDAIREDTMVRAQTMVDELRREPAAEAVRDVPVRVRAAAGRAAEHLVDEAAGADLLVVGSRGRSALRSSLLGSVALHCAAHAPCPVVVVHEKGGDDDGPVVVGIDDTEASRQALRHAAGEAARAGAALDVVAVYQPLIYWYWGDGEPPLETPFEAPEPTQEQVEARARRIVDEVLAALPEEGRPAAAVRAVEGIAGDVLVQAGTGARLLVVGSRGRNQLTGLVLGSVALHCVISSPCPVMVVHPAPQSAAGAAGSRAEVA